MKLIANFPLANNLHFWHNGKGDVKGILCKHTEKFEDHISFRPLKELTCKENDGVQIKNNSN